MGAQLLGAGRHPHHRLPGRAQPRDQRRRRLQPADGTRRPDTGFHAAHRRRLVPRLGVAAGVDPAPAGAGRPVRVRLPGPAGLRRRGARRAVGTRRRLHRPARVGRGVHPRRGLDRAGPDVGAVRRRGPHPAGGHAAPGDRGADQRRHRTLRIGAGVLQHRHPRPRGPARHAALHRRGVADDLRRRPARRRAAGRRRRPADHRRRADVRVGGQPGRRGVDHRRRRPAQAAARIRSGRPAEGGVGAAGADPARAGQMVSRRTVAALADCALLAHRRASAVDRRRAAGRPVGSEPTSPAATTRRPTRCSPGSPTAWGCRSRRCGRPTRTRCPGWPPKCGCPTATRWTRPTTSPPKLVTTPPRGRAALLARLDESTTAPAAFVLPLHRRDDDLGWASANWRLRRGRIVLLEGDSPAGLRLPLDSISWRAAARDVRRRPVDRGSTSCRTQPDTGDAVLDDPDDAPPTAMVAEVRDGLLYVFLPPTEALEHFVDLIARVEAAAAKADCPVVIEGYGPPPDPRLKSMTITPDPGVIEVNVRAHRQLRRTNAAAGNAVRAGALGPVVHGVVRLRRHPRRHRRRQPHHAGRRHARGLAAAAPSRPAGLAADLLAAAPVAVLPVRRAIRRHHVAGAAGRRGPRRGAVRTRDRVRRDRPADSAWPATCQTLGDRPRAAAPAHRHHRQHPSRRVLHRQALQPRQPPRQAGPAGAARLRDAAASADGDGAVAAGALAGGVVLGRTAARPADPPRRQPARAIPVAALPDSRHRRRRRRPARARHRLRDQLAGPVHRIPLPAHRHRGVRRRRDRAARGDRAVEHPRRGVHRDAAPPATSTRRSSASRSASSAPTATATW